MHKKFNEICQKIAQSEYKLTPQRKTILKTFLDKESDHLSAEDVYALVKQSEPDIGLATVYRTLDLLAELGILQKMNFGDGKSRYEFSHADVHHHHHLICLNCGKVLEFEDDLLDSVERAISKASNFTITNHEVKFYGYCSDCQTSNL